MFPACLLLGEYGPNRQGRKSADTSGMQVTMSLGQDLDLTIGDCFAVLSNNRSDWTGYDTSGYKSVIGTSFSEVDLNLAHGL